VSVKSHFYYFGRKQAVSDTRHNGIVAVAAEVDYDTKKVGLAFAFCSPKDQFVKTKARAMAAGRLKSSMYRHDTEYTGKLIVDVLRAFNLEIEPTKKPQIWRSRVVLLAPTGPTVAELAGSVVAVSQPVPSE
jgi:hypothetical protein